MMMYPGPAWRESAVADPTLAVAHQPAFEKCEFSSWAFKETVLHATITPTTSSSTAVFSHASPDSLLATPEVGEVCVCGGRRYLQNACFCRVTASHSGLSEEFKFTIAPKNPRHFQPGCLCVDPTCDIISVRCWCLYSFTCAHRSNNDCYTLQTFADIAAEVNITRSCLLYCLHQPVVQAAA